MEANNLWSAAPPGTGPTTRSASRAAARYQPAVSKSESIPEDEKADFGRFTAAERLFFNKYPE
jgi:hypothetical protein